MAKLTVTSQTKEDGKLTAEQTSKHFFDSKDELNEWLQNSCPYTLTEDEVGSLTSGKSVSREVDENNTIIFEVA